MAPAGQLNRNSMNEKEVLKSRADPSAEAVGADPARPVQADPYRSSTSVQQSQETSLLVPRSDHSDFQGYRHWGINE